MKSKRSVSLVLSMSVLVSTIGGFSSNVKAAGISLNSTFSNQLLLSTVTNMIMSSGSNKSTWFDKIFDTVASNEDVKSEVKPEVKPQPDSQDKPIVLPNPLPKPVYKAQPMVPRTGEVVAEGVKYRGIVKVGTAKITNASGFTKEQKDKLEKCLAVHREMYAQWSKNKCFLSIYKFNEYNCPMLDAINTCNDLNSILTETKVRNNEVKAMLVELLGIYEEIGDNEYVIAKTKFGFNTFDEFQHSYNEEMYAYDTIGGTLALTYVDLEDLFNTMK